MRIHKAVWIGAGIAAGVAGLALARKATRHGFHDQVVVIAGGSRGLGLELARQFADEGAELVLLARDGAELTSAKRDLQRNHRARVSVLTCDVTDQEDVARAFTTIDGLHDGCDVLVNVAGVIQVGPAEAMRDSDLEDSLAVHVRGPWYTCREARRRMRQRGGGRIINIASIAGVVAVPHLAPYTAGKFGTVGLSLALDREWRREGIAVTTVCPWLMRTGSIGAVEFRGEPQRQYRWFAPQASLPLVSQRVECAARDIVNACARRKHLVVLTPQGRAAAFAAGHFPRSTALAMDLFARLLPKTGNQHAATGATARPAGLPRGFDRGARAAARQHNEPAI